MNRGRSRGWRARRKHRVLFQKVDEQRGRCALCGLPFTVEHPPTVDHIRPRANNGTDAIANIQAAHEWCNVRRGASTLETFRRRVECGEIETPPGIDSQRRLEFRALELAEHDGAGRHFADSDSGLHDDEA
jgi:hypothetical protein